MNIAPNYVKVVIYREPGRKFFRLGESAVFAGGNAFGDDDQTLRVDSYIWPFSTREGAASALTCAVALFREAELCGYRPKLVAALDDLSIFGTPPRAAGVPVAFVGLLPGAALEDYGD